MVNDNEFGIQGHVAVPLAEHQHELYCLLSLPVRILPGRSAYVSLLDIFRASNFKFGLALALALSLPCSKHREITLTF